LLDYSQPPPEVAATRRRPKWVYVILAIYLLCLAALLLLPAASALLDTDWQGVAFCAGYVVALVLCGLGMVLVPVRVKQRRPIHRRSVWITIIAAGLLLALLVSGAALAIGEYVRHEWSTTALIGIPGCVWAMWTIIFGLISRSTEPAGLAWKLQKLVVSGSALELLIAVPTHIVVRRRPDCCAGLETGIGICVGVSVMIVAFGPAVLLLYWKRWKQITGR
jgi:hypothetical protein